MSDKVPILNYQHIISALERLGFVVTRQKGSHIRLERLTHDSHLKITVPAHRPVKRSTLSHILKQAEVTLREFLDSL